MHARWNIVKNLKRFYQPAPALQRFCSQAFVDADLSQTISKLLQEDPSSLVRDELSQIGNELRVKVTQRVEIMCIGLATAAKYYFHERAGGKLFRPAVSLLMASALNVPNCESLRKSQQVIAKATEIIHVASLLHNHELGSVVKSVKSVMGNELPVATGRFLMGDASCAISQLNNTEVNDLFAQVINDTVDAERMQMDPTPAQCLSMEYYLKKTEKKTASLISKSCEAISIVAGNTDEVSMLASEYGRNLGLAYQLHDDLLDFTGNKHGIVTAPILFAIKEFPQLGEVVERGFSSDDLVRADVDLALEYLGKSRGIESTKQLAQDHANRAKEIIEAFPYCEHDSVLLAPIHVSSSSSSSSSSSVPPIICCNKIKLEFSVLPNLTTIFEPRMYASRNIITKLKRFYQPAPALQRFYSHALADADLSQTISKGDPYSLVRDELSQIATELCEEVAQGVERVSPELAIAAKYYFNEKARGKLFRPAVLLLMASALNVPNCESLRKSQQVIAKATEIIHVASLLHDDVLDNADTRRGVKSVNSVMGNELAVAAGRFLMGDASCAIAELNNTELNDLFAQVICDIVAGERMQMHSTPAQRLSMEYYLKKTEKKTASLISKSCEAISIVAGNTDEVSIHASQYGKYVGLVYQLADDLLDFTGNKDVLGKGVLSDIKHGIVTAPILFAIKEFPQLGEVVERGFSNPADVDLALEYLGKSRGMESTKQLAQDYANRAKEIIQAFPYCNDERVLSSRRALMVLPSMATRRSK
ncbi:hypothetical protein LUZ60_001973 [Juncus effusus]|nr:hypothetical protein LUZ60_001973 [Juncus effusus]